MGQFLGLLDHSALRKKTGILVVHRSDILYLQDSKSFENTFY